MRLRSYAILGLVAVAAAAPPVFGLRWNASASMPQGLYRFAALQDAPRRGQVVGLCLPSEWAELVLTRAYAQGGACPEGHEPLLKPVAAVPGDVVSVTSEGVSVNGMLAVSPPLSQDAAGRPLRAVPAGVYRVAQGTVWVLSNHDPRSFDSRYLGPIAFSSIVAAAQPLLVGR